MSENLDRIMSGLQDALAGRYTIRAPRVCGKFPYQSPKMAHEVAKRMNRRRLTGEMPLQVYRFRACGHHHIGHKDRGI